MLKYLTKKFVAVFSIWFIVSLLSKLLLNHLFQDSTTVLATIRESVILAFFFSLIVQLIYLFRFRQMGIKPDSGKVFDTVQKRIFETNASMNDIKHRVENLFSKKASQVKEGSFSMELVNLISWSRLSVKELSMRNGLSRIEVVVRPAMRLNVLDFAENQLIMKKVCEALKNLHNES